MSLSPKLCFDSLQVAVLKERFKIDLRVVGVMTSKTMYLDES